MEINVALRDEHCAVIGDMVVDLQGVIAQSLPALNDKNYCFIRFIDPYGDTIFNHIQSKYMIEEWDQLHEFFTVKDAEQLWSDIRKLIAFCASDIGSHHYVVFIGD